MEQIKSYIEKKEFRMLCVGALGQGMVYGIMSSYISDFYLNVFGLGPIFVLLLMLLARVWDAINDPLMGMIADRTDMKWGKMKPYLIMTPLPIAVLTVLLFFAPGLSPGAKMVYATITYVMWGMVYTMSDVPFWSLPNLMTPDPDERGRAFSVARTTNGIGSAIPMAIFMILGPLLSQFGLTGVRLEKTRYLIIAVFASLLGNILFASTYFHVKERVNIPQKKREPGEPGSLKLLFKNKPLVLVLIMGVLSFGRYMFQAGAIHVARYSFYIGPPLRGLTVEEQTSALQASISKISLVFALATAVGMFGTMLFMPKLIKRFSYKALIISSCLLGFVSSMGIYIIGFENFWAIVPLLVISCIPAGVINVVSAAMIGDSLDYMELKTGRREAGLGSAVQSFVNKLGNSLATTLIVLMYKVVNIDLSAVMNTGMTLAPTSLEFSQRNGIFTIVSLIPALSLLLCAVPIFFYDLTGEKKQRVTQELALQREAKGIVVE